MYTENCKVFVNLLQQQQQQHHLNHHHQLNNNKQTLTAKSLLKTSNFQQKKSFGVEIGGERELIYGDEQWTFDKCANNLSPAQMLSLPAQSDGFKSHSHQVNEILDNILLGGKTSSVVCLGANCMNPRRYDRIETLCALVAEMNRKMEILRENDPNSQYILSFACIGMTDSRCVDLVSERSLSAKRLQHGIPEYLFEPIDTLSQVSEFLLQPIAMAGFLLQIRVEKIPIRVALHLDKDIDQNRNVFHALAATSEEGMVGSVGNLILADLGTPRFFYEEQQAVSADDGTVLASIASLSKSVRVLGDWIHSMMNISNGQLNSASFNYDESRALSYEHVLCRLLRNSFGGSSRTYMLIDIEVSGNFNPEVFHALELGEKIRQIRNVNLMERLDERVPILNSMEKKYKKLRKQIDLRNSELSKANEWLAKFKTANGKFEDKVSSLKSEIHALQAETNSKQEEITQLKHQLEKQVTKLKEQLVHKKQDFENSKQSHQDALKKLKDEYRELKGQMKDMIADSEAESKRYQTQMADMETMLREKDQEILALKSENQEIIELKSRNEELMTKVDSLNAAKKDMETFEELDGGKHQALGAHEMPLEKSMLDKVVDCMSNEKENSKSSSKKSKKTCKKSQKEPKTEPEQVVVENDSNQLSENTAESSANKHATVPPVVEVEAKRTLDEADDKENQLEKINNTTTAHNDDDDPKPPKASSETSKKRKVFAEASEIPLPLPQRPSRQHITAPSFSSIMNKKSVSSSVKPKNTTEKGKISSIINPQALQMIKDKFTIPKIAPKK